MGLTQRQKAVKETMDKRMLWPEADVWLQDMGFKLSRAMYFVERRKVKDYNKTNHYVINPFPGHACEDPNTSFEEWNKLHLLEDGQPITLHDYELELFGMLESNKHVWVKKATGLGITELMLRYMAWKCETDQELKGGQIIIVTGPRLELSVTLIDRIKKLYEDVPFTKNTVVELNGVRIEAFPSHHLDSARGLPNVRFIFLDEADFFPLNEQLNARAIAERYMAKGNPHIVMVSTPNLPGGMFETIEREEPCIYKKLFFPYQRGLGRIYKDKEIEKAKESRSFPREYELQYGYGIGNMFPHDLLKHCIEEYDLTIGNGSKGLYVDPAYGNSDTSSKFGLVGFEKINGIKYVKLAQQYTRASPSAMFEIVKIEAKKFGNRVRVDSAHPGLIRDLREAGINCSEMVFSKELSEMVAIASQDVKDRKVRIHPAFRDLINQLIAVETNERGNPDKKKLTFDMGDAWIMGCKDLRENIVRIIKV